MKFEILYLKLFMSDYPTVSILVIIAFNLILFARTLRYGLVIDDIEQRKFVLTSGYLFEYMSLWVWPWVIGRAIRRQIYGVGTFPLLVEHAITLTLHIITCILIYFYAGLCPALLYSACPVNHQLSIWLNGRRYAVLNILVLIGLLTHTIVLITALVVPILACHFVERNKARRKLYRIVRTPLAHIMVVFKSVGFNVIKLTGCVQIMSLYPFLEDSTMKSLEAIDCYAVIGFFVCLALVLFHPFILILLLLVSGTLAYTQTCADRYLVLPTILLLSVVPSWVIVLLPLYLYRSVELQVMYCNIQSFYDYHSNAFPALKKLPLLKKLYPTVV